MVAGDIAVMVMDNMCQRWDTSESGEMVTIVELKCKNCGGVLGASAICSYCGARYVIESNVGNVPIRDIPEDCPRTYLAADLVDRLYELDVLYWMTGRLTAANLAIGICNLNERLYKNGPPTVQLSYHLVIPPRLYLQVLVIMETDKLSGDKNVLPRFIEYVWIDRQIKTVGPNWPWYLFVDEASIFSEQADCEKICYSNGTTP